MKEIQCCNCWQLFKVKGCFGNDETARYCPDERCQRTRRTKAQHKRRVLAKWSKTQSMAASS